MLGAAAHPILGKSSMDRQADRRTDRTTWNARGADVLRFFTPSPPRDDLTQPPVARPWPESCWQWDEPALCEVQQNSGHANPSAQGAGLAVLFLMMVSVRVPC